MRKDINFPQKESKNSNQENKVSEKESELVQPNSNNEVLFEKKSLVLKWIKIFKKVLTNKKFQLTRLRDRNQNFEERCKLFSKR